MRITLRSACAVLLLGAGAAGPLTAQGTFVAGDRLARDGVTAPPPAGFQPFQLFQGPPSPGVRIYVSRAGTREIRISVLDPFSSWGGEDVEIRRDHLKLVENRMNAGTGAPFEAQVQDDETHLVKTMRLSPGPEGRGIGRVYVARTGAPRVVGIRVVDRNPAADPATDPAILAFLDAARPPAHDGRSADPVTFRRAGVELALPAGIAPPMERSQNLPPGDRLFVSHSGPRRLAVSVYDSRERGAENWPADRRARHMRRHGDAMVQQAGGRADEQAFEANGLLYRDFAFSRVGRTEVTGRGRMYMPLSGVPVVIIVMYYEDGAAQLDEAETVALFDSLRMAPEDEAPR